MELPEEMPPEEVLGKAHRVEVWSGTQARRCQAEKGGSQAAIVLSPRVPLRAELSGPLQELLDLSEEDEHPGEGELAFGSHVGRQL
jgi:hypothetical protein